jgi:hypothetical protein
LRTCEIDNIGRHQGQGVAKSNLTDFTGSRPEPVAAVEACSARARETLMEIVVFAKRLRNGSWEVWEHTCSEEKVDAVEDSARAKTLDRLSFDPIPRRAPV